MVQDSTLHCQCTHPLPAKRRISDAQGDPGRAFYNCATQQCHFFLWEDELPSPPSSSPSAAAAAMIPAGPPLKLSRTPSLAWSFPNSRETEDFSARDQQRLG
ncbi:hypothetical protein FA13DRAFT_896111 [Coprinellus micaceus]|uniref:GRF-type domain-containing protein n=1 Tax=Coprinellus micaceus TaxID=71717 RepID=A0A4Y7TTU3_COPMI|nr:hypothetical protein FA13DRAFT_896111 [Coprinellus micaceus]